MAGEVGAQLIQGAGLQARFEQALGLARAVLQGLVDQLLDRAATAAVALADLHQRRRTDGQVDVVQADLRCIACQLAAAAVAARAAHQPGLVHLRQQAADHHRVGRQAGGQLFGGTRAFLADQVGHHVQGVGERVSGFHVTTIVTFKPSVEGPLLFHLDTFVP